MDGNEKVNGAEGIKVKEERDVVAAGGGSAYVMLIHTVMILMMRI
jgi:hypothetical protein